jgi:KUP system potassium uptake protein
MSESQAAVGPRDTASIAHARPHGPGWPVATIGALGVVFGDIGTSPIYTIQTIFNPEDPHPVAVSPVSVYGLLSLVFWSVTIIVTILYVGLVLRADNEGEGGILSLITLLSRGRTTSSLARSWAVRALTTLGIFGASLFLADSMITPAISVLSAVEGLRVVRPELEPLVIPITVVIIVVLFAVQRAGTAKVARSFGPVMALWFISIGLAGAAGIAAEPHISCGALVIEFSREHVTGHVAEVLETVNRGHDDRRAAVASREPGRACLPAR